MRTDLAKKVIVESKALVPFSDFSFEGNPVRTHVMEDGTVMFHGGDVCRILGYANGSRDIKRHCKRWKTLRSTETVGLELNPRGELFIPESDVYRLVMRSNMPHAERFQTWVCEEVIPSLRKTGRYQIAGREGQYARLPCSNFSSVGNQIPDTDFSGVTRKLSFSWTPIVAGPLPSRAKRGFCSDNGQSWREPGFILNICPT